MRIEVKAKHFPRLTKWHVRRALKWINIVDLAGIEYICLLDEDPKCANVLKQPAHLRGFTYDGYYVKGNKHTATRINLYTRDLYLGIPSMFKATPVATLRIAFTLAHEVAHHVIEKRGYIHTPTEQYKPYGLYDEHKENMCDTYAHNTIRKMSANWDYKLGHFLCRRLSSFYLDQGAYDWEHKNYDKAAYYWFYAYTVNEDNHDAADAYHKAIEKLAAQNHHPAKLRISRENEHRFRGKGCSAFL